MKQIRYISNAYIEKQEDDFKTADITAYIQGLYVRDALLCTVGNMFGDKNSKFTYPEKAYSLAREEEKLSEDEIQRQRDAFVATLQTMAHNFNRNKKMQEET